MLPRRALLALRVLRALSVRAAVLVLRLRTGAGGGDGAADAAGGPMCQGLTDTTFKPPPRLGLDGGDTLPLHPSLVGHYLRCKPEPEP